ncbi:30S ribosomal protein S21 [Candidatus Dojkabacteria bacterium]|nr:30S ribosomal protein S21 [Candidatus Dojkabacteria bacterium]
MANVSRVRVELKKKYNEPHRNFKLMLEEFRRQVSDAGVLHTYKEHSVYESDGEKKRRKKKEREKKFAQERLEQSILAGERVSAPAGFIKKVLAKTKKKKYRNTD